MSCDSLQLNVANVAAAVDEINNCHFEMDSLFHWDQGSLRRRLDKWKILLVFLCLTLIVTFLVDKHKVSLIILLSYNISLLNID
jgi:hypothetical protein